MGMRNVISLIVGLMAVSWIPGGSGLNITARNETIPNQSDSLINTFVSPFCIIESNFTLSLSTVESRWIFNETTLTPGLSGRYLVNEGEGLDDNFETILLVQRLIYSDAGIYTCEVRDTRDPNSPGPWISDKLTLQLLVNLTVNASEVYTFDNATEVELSCEMSLYLRPDEDLQWFKDGERIVSGNRYIIIYTNGSRNRGQFGGTALVPTRVSTLIISEPQLSDSATYTCAIQDTVQSQNIALTVEESNGQVNPSTVQPPAITSSLPNTANPSSSTKTENLPPSTTRDTSSTLGPLIGGVAGALLTVITAVVILIGILVCCKRRVKTDTPKEHQYDYVTTTESEELVYDYASTLSAEGLYPVPSIKTSTNAAYELNEPTAVQRHEDEKHPSVVHIETNVNSAYGIHQENGVTAVQTDENQVHIETGINPAYGLHQGNGLAENKTRTIVVQTDENQVQPTTEGDVPMVQIEAGANSAYGVLQENFRL